MLPAPSVQEPVTCASLVSGPLYVPEVQELIPEGPPSPENVTATGLVYHPFESGSRANDGSTEGGLESFWTVTLLPMNPLGERMSVHVTVVPAVSSVTVDASHPVWFATPAASYDHLTVTFDRNQPPHAPPLHEGAGTDAARPNPGATRTATTATSARQRSRPGLT